MSKLCATLLLIGAPKLPKASIPPTAAAQPQASQAFSMILPANKKNEQSCHFLSIVIVFFMQNAEHCQSRFTPALRAPAHRNRPNARCQNYVRGFLLARAILVGTYSYVGYVPLYVRYLLYAVPTSLLHDADRRQTPDQKTVSYRLSDRFVPTPTNCTCTLSKVIAVARALGIVAFSRLLKFFVVHDQK